MKMSKKERRFWKTRFGTKNPKELPDHIDHLNWKLADVTDEQLGWLTSRISSITMLDLDENRLTNSGIAHLTNMDYLAELRLKGNLIDDEAIEYIKQLKDLELLHLGSTNITIDGILKLTSLSNLKKLLFSLDESNDPSKLKEFTRSLPDCEIIINHKIYYRPPGKKPDWMS